MHSVKSILLLFVALCAFSRRLEAQDLRLQGFGAFVAPGRGGHAENVHVGFTGVYLFNKQDLENGPRAGLEFEAGYFSAYCGFPNGSALLSAGVILDPIKRKDSKVWPRITSGVSIAPVLREGFRPGFYVGAGVNGWRLDSGSSVTWGGIEFRDYLFRVGSGYDHYYQIRFSIIGWD